MVVTKITIIYVGFLSLKRTKKRGSMARPNYEKGALALKAGPVIRRLGERIRCARRGRGLTIAELAEKAGVAAETVRRLEMGNLGASLSLLFAVLFVLGHEDELERLVELSRDRGYVIGRRKPVLDREERKIREMLNDI